MSSVTLLVFLSHLVRPHTVTHYALWAYFPVEVQIKHLKLFGTSLFHPTCQDCKVSKPQGTVRGHMGNPSEN